MTTPHQNADLLRAIADGKQMQVEGNDGKWHDASAQKTLISLLNKNPCRVKPETILVNGVECPSEAPDDNARYRIEVSQPSTCNHQNLWFKTAEEASIVYGAILKPFKEIGK